eukprot:757267-Alexandrium_andersonii.AAC.1
MGGGVWRQSERDDWQSILMCAKGACDMCDSVAMQGAGEQPRRCVRECGSVVLLMGKWSVGMVKWKVGRGRACWGINDVRWHMPTLAARINSCPHAVVREVIV